MNLLVNQALASILLLSKKHELHLSSLLLLFSLIDSSDVPAIVVSSAPLTPPSLSTPVVSAASPAVPNIVPTASAASPACTGSPAPSPAAASTTNPAPAAAPAAAAVSNLSAPASKPSAGTNNPEEAARVLAEKRRQAREQREREEQERLEQEHKNRSDLMSI